MEKPKRGEVWIVDLGYKEKTRPCVVLSVGFQDHERAVMTYVPRTTVPRQTRFEVAAVAVFFDKSGVFDAQGLGTADQTRLRRKLGTLTVEQLLLVEGAVKRWLGF